MRKPHHMTGVCLPRETSTGRLLTRARAKRQMSQQEMADRLGRQRGNIMHIETGRRGIPGGEVLSFARAYRCDPVALLRALERYHKRSAGRK
jgi:transcriptional regulator with XRE-family HTH domain